MQTLFIVGAGASKEVDLPVGDELKQSISNLLDIKSEFGRVVNADKFIIRVLDIYQNYDGVPQANYKDYMKAINHIHRAMPQAISIDNFIDTHSENKCIEFCGKLAIVRSILLAERESKLYFDKSNINSKINFDKLKDTWFSRFFMLLTENCKISDLPQRLKSNTFIIFNYDRCIEHFLYYSIQNYYGIQKKGGS